MNGWLLLNEALCLHRSVDPVKMFCQIPMVLWSVWFRLHVLTIANVLHYFTHVSGLQRGVRQKLSFVRLIDLSSWGSLRIGIVLECIGEHVEIHIGRACSSINRFNLISFVQWFNLIPFVYYVNLILFVHYDKVCTAYHACLSISHVFFLLQTIKGITVFFTSHCTDIYKGE